MEAFRTTVGCGKKTLQRASSLQNKCPEWYVAMRDVALAQGSEAGLSKPCLSKPSKLKLLFYYYRKYAVSILPQRDGQDGQLEKFLQNTADQIGGDTGDILYFEVASLVVCCIDQPLKFSWPRNPERFRCLGETERSRTGELESTFPHGGYLQRSSGRKQNARQDRRSVE